MSMQPNDDETPPRNPDRVRAVTTVAELATLDERAMVRGYKAGLDNVADFTERDRGYWHGYTNGLVDGGHARTTPEQQALARDYTNGGALRLDVERWKKEGAPC